MSGGCIEVLLIGGSADGSRRLVSIDQRGQPIVASMRIARPRTLKSYLPISFASEPSEPNEELYKRVALRDGRGWYYVFVHENDEPKVMARLIENYEPKRQKKGECQCFAR